jgi:hypothetical protein
VRALRHCHRRWFRRTFFAADALPLFPVCVPQVLDEVGFATTAALSAAPAAPRGVRGGAAAAQPAAALASAEADDDDASGQALMRRLAALRAA